MEPQDDPEQRIRQLEQPLNDVARTSELGATPYSGGGAYVPPAEPYPPGGFYPPPPVPPMPAGSPYGAPPYGTPFPMTGRPVSAGFRPLWFLIAGVVFAVVALTVGIVVYSVNTATRGISISTAPRSPGATFGPGSGGGPTIVIPSIPSAPSRPTVTTVPPGGQLTVSGMNQNKTIACKDGTVTISGISNTVTVTGHCLTLTVSGMQNKVVIDGSDAIIASGFDNQVTYHSGSPQVDNSGGNNVVQQG
jgi:hypothetical protein